MMKLQEGTKEFEKLKKEWVKAAKDMTIEKLPDFLKQLTEKYQHDYGTICHATAISAIAAAWAIDHSSQGGITGFQAGAVMWQFIRDWNYSRNKTGLRIIDYDDFLLPQSADKYQKIISKDIWINIKKEAKQRIKKADSDYARYLSDCNIYSAAISAYVAKYPDYYERTEYYDHLGFGTWEQHEEEKKKEKSGFQFAPTKPYEPFHPNVYDHWVSIVNGIIPFGYCVKDC